MFANIMATDLDMVVSINNDPKRLVKEPRCYGKHTGQSLNISLLYSTYVFKEPVQDSTEIYSLLSCLRREP